ncbi:acylphosphatase [Candidatus Aerophobetes bacterium]|uniref:acylphosphatase n=1 Tax=Aerophobetes bacterium TaxID=2030807 RepID=A0A497E4C5_UNCAE|nr:acylphosphatase [Candidatus Aerophobetes bacterium]RLE09316.1 MAG: acylphosphatase [Candidatus Aerophobetes bacterium]
MSKVRAYVLISGRVQGVFFRSSAREQAYRLRVNGWIRNRWDGQVEAVFEGEEEDVLKMIEWCHKGPPGALVEDVKVRWEEYKGEFNTFFIRY